MDVGAKISGDRQYEFGLATSATILSGGIQVVASGAVGSATTVSSGGAAEGFGTESGTVILARPSRYRAAVRRWRPGPRAESRWRAVATTTCCPGVASGTKVAGLDDVYGTDIGTVVSAGALHVVLGTASGTSVAGEQLIYALGRGYGSER